MQPANDNETETEPDHDVELQVKDFDQMTSGERGPNGKDIVWHRTDDRPVLSPEEYEAFEDLQDEAHDRLDIDAIEHDAVIAHIWIEDRDVDRVEWVHRGE